MKDAITNAISKEIEFDDLSVEGSESKYTVSIISNVFEGLRPVARQQRVYAPLGEFIRSGALHAVNINTKTP